MIKRISQLVLIPIFLMIMVSPVMAAYEELSGGKYFTLVDENNQVIHETAMQVYPGDEYIAADNSKYKVQEIIGDTARCIYQGKEVMPEVQYNDQQHAWVVEGDAVQAQAGKQKVIAIYHTHSDESYVPNDGKPSIDGKGGIYDVGSALAKKLTALGFKVEYNTNNHNPHDINAYNRSRKTAMTLLRANPDAIFDVHRDAVPASQYQTQVQGQPVTKVKLVVGKSNPNENATIEFAKRIKAVMDKKDPGLSNGIYIGKGDYNQDLSPRAMLIEVGSDTNNKDDAEKGVALFASTLPSVLGIAPGSADASGQPPAPAAKPLTGENRGAWTSILIILVVVAAAGVGFYYLNRGSVKR